MRRHRVRSSWVVLWAGLFFLSLRPLEPVVLAVDFLTAPVRLVAELASPLTLLRRPQVLAAEERLARGATEEARESERLLADLARTALPSDPELLANRRIVHAEVLGRIGTKDRVRVRLRDTRGLVRGLPVACGNAYVGRLVELTRPGEGERGFGVVELVTAPGFHVGARVRAPLGTDSSDVLMTVGGVVEGGRSARSGAGGGEVRLEVHHPSDRTVLGGLARVHEHLRDAEAFAELAEGFRLGPVRPAGTGGVDERLTIVPELDYLDGLFQLVVLAPPDPSLDSALAFETVLMDRHWLRARPLSVGDPSPWRATTKVSVGRLKGVRSGAAVTSIGARLLGRVGHAGLYSSDVAFLADPGFQLVAVARFDDEPEPKVLGRLVSLGRDLGDPATDDPGAIRFRWIVRVALELETEGTELRHARLFTGSGDPGLPAGFLIGTAEIPVDAAPGEERELSVVTDLDPRNVRALFVRASGEPTP